MSVYTHGHHESVLRSHRSRTAENSAAHLLPLLRPTDHLLDVGAGPGTITADLATRVTRVTATETGEAELALARRTASERGITTIDFQVADVHDLPFPDATFDVAHAHQVLQHVLDPVVALRELARVTRPGGLVSVRESDYSGFCWFPELPGLDRWLDLYRAAARANGAEPDAGRRLLSWAHAAGLAEVRASSSTWCYADPPARAWWGGMWADRIIDSALAHQLTASGLASPDDLAEIAAAWRVWAADPDAWFSVLHAEILVQLP